MIAPLPSLSRKTLTVLISEDVADPPPVIVTAVKSDAGFAATVKPAKTTLAVPCKITPDGCGEISASVVDATGVTLDQVVPTLISSIINVAGVSVVLDCLKKIL